jgi:nucleotide sugar dehydrogenase
MKIGIVGYGFVGKAVGAGFANHTLVIADPTLGTSTETIIKERPSVVFICVPTPMGDDGKIDSSIVENVLNELSHLDTLLVLKSTVIPDIVHRFSKQYKNFVYNPEFLTERNAIRDFLNPQFHVFGGNYKNCIELNDIYKESLCAPCDVHYVSAVEAAFIKYGINSFLMTKVMFWNQFEKLCAAEWANYDVVKHVIGCDPRIGQSHMDVPGHDGRRGSAGACFSKDIPALIHFSENRLSILKESWNVNCKIRNSYPNKLPREIEQNITFKEIE